VTYLGHDGFFLEGKNRIMIDPYKVTTQRKADIVCVTHEHYDHCNPEDLRKITTPRTTYIGSIGTKDQVSDIPFQEAFFLQPGEERVVQGVQIRAVPAYNIDKFRSPGNPFHPKDMKGVGFLLTMEGVTVYHAGDTDAIPEMAGLPKGIDLAFLPVSGTYVMTADEAKKAIELFHPKQVIPMHYGVIVGSLADAKRLGDRVGETKVTVLRAA